MRNNVRRAIEFPASIFWLRFSALAVLLTLCAAGQCAPPAALTVVPGEGTLLDGQAAYFEFGTRSSSDDAPLVHVFVLRNEAASPVVIVRLQSSCGCTTAAAGANTLPLTVAPGQSIPIRIQVSPRRLLPGETRKSVWVYTRGGGDAATLLEIRGTVQDDAVSAKVLPPSAPTQSRRGHISAALPTLGYPAPALIGTDTQNRKLTLTAQRGHPVALLFLCGCPWCAALAQAWGQKQHGGTLPAGTQTIVIFDGNQVAACAFAAAHALDLRRTTLLPDPDASLTEGVYKVNSCPRVFALDAQGTIRYTNNHPDDQPRQVPAKVLANRLRFALNSRPRL